MRRNILAAAGLLSLLLLLTAGTPPRGSYFGGSYAAGSYVNTGAEDPATGTWIFSSYDGAENNTYWPASYDSLFADSGDGEDFRWWRIVKAAPDASGHEGISGTNILLPIGVDPTGPAMAQIVCLDWDLSALTDLGDVTIDSASVLIRTRYSNFQPNDGDGFRVVIDTLSAHLATADADTVGDAEDLRYKDVRWARIHDGLGWSYLGESDTTFACYDRWWELGIVSDLSCLGETVETYSHHKIDCTDALQQYVDWAQMKIAAGLSADIAGIFVTGEGLPTTYQMMTSWFGSSPALVVHWTQKKHSAEWNGSELAFAFGTDDGNAGNADYWAIADSMDGNLTAFVIGSAIGDTKLGWDVLDSLQNTGMTLGWHSYYHRSHDYFGTGASYDMTVDGHSDSLDTDVDTGWALWENYDPATGTGTIPTGSGRFWCGAYPLCASCVETWKRLSAAGYLGMRGGNEGATVGSANGKDGERYLSWDDTTNVMNIANYPMASLVGDWDDDPTEDEVRANVRDMIGTAMLGGRWMMSTFAHNPKQPGITSGCDLDEFRWIFDEIADNGRIWNASWDDAMSWYRGYHVPCATPAADTMSANRGVTAAHEIYWTLP
jgi:hypothetical protein